ncbi:889_t:CDS:2 [Paraglomus brasilianum]|uniref:889_t:CDS:1 n=1 Tax=Paraglomus brasilianum TaxID=144538 RepID=A0A9N9BI18_9GLOM|nr:889_t:CDS:2 [Paraglomus brasilianum]
MTFKQLAQGTDQKLLQNARDFGPADSNYQDKANMSKGEITCKIEALLEQMSEPSEEVW